ncbi:unnamed protein product [Caenorhabditis angaria]|uniref:Uncharacterized protein n=1 Tax=Caenorhabditis angaria TaxID=860376 RepID=A0A9P1NCT2_9PELO|nr:unnamed protein product [Caenorhabditis angaria]
MSQSGEILKDEFWDDDDIESVEPDDCGKRLKGLLIRVAISLFFIGCCTGAIIFSFINGETGTQHETHRDASKNFSIFIDQYSKKEGLYILTYKLPDDAEDDQEPAVEEFDSFWIQSDTNKTLVHRITQNVTIYAFPTHSYWYDTTNGIKCTFDRSTTYTTYINSLGMTSLVRNHQEYEQTHQGDKVYVYQGNPNEVLLSNVNQTAFLVTAYADAVTGALLAWDTYFTADDHSSDMVYKASYEYSSMTPAKPDPSWFTTPEQCSPN